MCLEKKGREMESVSCHHAALPSLCARRDGRTQAAPSIIYSCYNRDDILKAIFYNYTEIHFFAVGKSTVRVPGLLEQLGTCFLSSQMSSGFTPNWGEVWLLGRHHHHPQAPWHSVAAVVWGYSFSFPPACLDEALRLAEASSTPTRFLSRLTRPSLIT